MDLLKASNSSKVTVEYTDPSGIFHLVSDGLQRRLPLRNLHWNSSSRPLRSISSLHIELIPADRHVSQNWSPYLTLEDAVQLTAPNASQPGIRPLQSAESRKERRHQIPGLRQTPYLKIYLLRCDDTETYKSVSRKLLRDWVKEHTPPSQSSVSINKGENHDAFEWLIIHVLPPIGDPSNGAVDSRSPNEDIHGDRGSNTTRWSTRGSSTVIEKIRADFNGTSKAAIDRVAQIQVGEDLGLGSVAHPSNSFSDPQSMDDKKGWNDLASKLKFLILASFDLRVSQYEEDIKEKDSQRNLPGWNFNTFFVLKEGLARGFESVGLIEDALLSYHELAAALNNIVDAQYTRSSTERQTGLFREFTDDLREEFKQAASVLQGDLQSHDISRNSHDFGALILDTDRKHYRELILANNISAFDFMCYVFARKMSLLLRLSNVHDSSFDARTGDSEPNKSDMYIKSSGPGPTSVEKDAENLLILSDLCRQAVEFITSVARTIRIDLRISIEDLAQTNKAIESLPETIQNDIIENLVASWIFSTSQCVLGKTLTKSFSTKLQPLMSQFDSFNDAHESYFEDFVNTSEPVKLEEPPPRTSSLPSRTSGLDKSFAQEKFPAVTMPDAVRILPSGSSQTGSPELAAQRAELTSLARSALGILGLRHNLWKGCWSDLDSTQPFETEMDEVSLEDTVKDDRDGLESSPKISQASSISSIQNQALRLALKSTREFYAAYENLTASILALYVLCDRQKSAQAMTAEIAAIRFHMGDYQTAASYFHQLAPFYAKDDWDSLEMSMLNMYAQCLKNIGRHEEYIRVGLKMVAKLSRQRRSLLSVLPNAAHKPLSLSDLISTSRSLKEPITVPLDKYFRDITVDPYPRHYDDHDGFQLQLKLWNATLGAFKAQQVRVQISSIEEEIHSEIWLTSEKIHVLEPGIAAILIGTKIMIPAWYMLNKIMLRSENVIFTQDLSSSFHPGPLLAGSRQPGSRASVNNIIQPRILVWPLPEALEACLAVCNKIHLEQPRSVEIEVNTGWNRISRGRVLLRAGSAGLRLRTADALLISGNTTITDQSQPGSIGFGELSANAAMILRIPYDLESDLKEITVKTEVLYTTAKGDFIYACNPRIPTLLPLGVNVQDTFQQDALFSKFTISTANSIPLCITKCYVQDSPDFEVSSPSLATERLDIYARQPLSVMSRIHKKQRKGSMSEAKVSRPARLLLEIEYRCLDQEIYETLKQSFVKPLITSKLRDLTRLLVPALLGKQRSKLSVQDLEMIGLRREMPLDIVTEHDWTTVLAGIDLDRRHEAAQWLMDWQEKHSTILIQEDMQTSKLQYLTVPVDIPQMDVVHTAHLKLHHGHQKVSPELDYVAVGQPIPAELIIKHTRQWLTETEPQPSDEPLDFCYEVQANPDTWLIGGQRMAHFRAQEDELQSFPLLLIPQRTGHLLYPSLDITTTPSSGSKDSNKDQEGLDKAFHSSETDYRSQGETLLVVADLGSTTVSIDPGNPVTGTWLVDYKAPPRV